MIEQGIDWWGCYIPEGTYSVILATARRYDDDRYYNAYIVKNDVSIDKDMTVTFRQSDAQNLLTAKFKYPDGSDMEPLGEKTAEYCNYGYYRCLNNSDGIYCFNMMRKDSGTGARQEIMSRGRLISIFPPYINLKTVKITRPRLLSHLTPPVRNIVPLWCHAGNFATGTKHRRQLSRTAL